jgi:hypothetical protein
MEVSIIVIEVTDSDLVIELLVVFFEAGVLLSVVFVLCF